jgi:subtilisin family serine protease
LLLYKSFFFKIQTQKIHNKHTYHLALSAPCKCLSTIWNFSYYSKIIGARYYSSKEHENKSARDDTGHGSHTASTVAGNKVKGVSFFGLAKGTARGGVPSARIAAYKVCFSYGECPSEDVLAAFDAAIADGVDIISISLGSASLADYQCRSHFNWFFSCYGERDIDFSFCWQ